MTKNVQPVTLSIIVSVDMLHGNHYTLSFESGRLTNRLSGASLDLQAPDLLNQKLGSMVTVNIEGCVGLRLHQRIQEVVAFRCVGREIGVNARHITVPPISRGIIELAQIVRAIIQPRSIIRIHNRHQKLKNVIAYHSIEPSVG